MREFRPSRFLIPVYVFLALAFGLVAFHYFKAEGFTWITLSYCGMTVMGLGAILEAATTVVSISDSELAISYHLRRRVYQRADLVEASWARGAHSSVRLSDGARVHLPGVGAGSQSMAATLEAWVKRKHVA
jgi:hypothetical protein